MDIINSYFCVRY